MSPPVPSRCLSIVLAGSLVWAGCNLTIGFFPLQQCPPRMLEVEIPEDATAPPTGVARFHSTAGCTIIFCVKSFRTLLVETDQPRWQPIGGLDYELLVEPYHAAHGDGPPPLGRLEQGVLPEDGRVTVPTEPGHTSVRLTVFVPDGRFGDITERVAIVTLDPP